MNLGLKVSKHREICLWRGPPALTNMPANAGNLLTMPKENLVGETESPVTSISMLGCYCHSHIITTTLTSVCLMSTNL